MLFRSNGQRAGETRRCDSDYAEGVTIDEQRRAEDRAIVVLPVSMADNRNRDAVTRRLLFRQESPASFQRHTENGKIVRAYNRGETAADVALLSDANQDEIVSQSVDKSGVLVAYVAICGIGKSTVVFRVCVVVGIDLNQFARISEGRGSEEQVVDQAEHRGVNADAEGENDDGSGGKTGGLEQLPNGKSKIVNHKWGAF